MHREPLCGKWEHEPIFPASGAMKPDGSYFAFFAHMLYDGELVQTVRAEEAGKDCWDAYIEGKDGEVIHHMRNSYATMHEAFEDAFGWASGQ